MLKKIEPDVATELLLDNITVVGTERIALADGLGRVLAEDVKAAFDMPQFPRSPFDGYALKSADVRNATPEAPVTLRIVEEVPAGSWPTTRVTTGLAVKILTGSPVPEGADCVTKYEDTTFTPETVTISNPIPSGTNVIRIGEDLAKGSVMAEQGIKLTPPLLGLIAGQGFTDITVYKRLHVAFLTTGSELIPNGQPLPPGKIYDNNSPTLLAYLQALGCKTSFFGVIRDDLHEITDAIRRAAEHADIVITTGGASVGDYDFVRQALEQLNANILYWKTTMHPGGASVAAMYGNKPIYCLSGNPGAALLVYFRVLMPNLKKAMGLKDYLTTRATAKLRHALAKESPKGRLLRGHIEFADGDIYFVEHDGQGNGVLASYVGFNALAEIEPGSPQLEAGTPVKVLTFDGCG